MIKNGTKFIQFDTLTKALEIEIPVTDDIPTKDDISNAEDDDPYKLPDLSDNSEKWEGIYFLYLVLFVFIRIYSFSFIS